MILLANFASIMLAIKLFAKKCGQWVLVSRKTCVTIQIFSAFFSAEKYYLMINVTISNIYEIWRILNNYFEGKTVTLTM